MEGSEDEIDNGTVPTDSERIHSTETKSHSEQNESEVRMNSIDDDVDHSSSESEPIDFILVTPLVPPEFAVRVLPQLDIILAPDTPTPPVQTARATAETRRELCGLLGGCAMPIREMVFWHNLPEPQRESFDQYRMIIQQTDRSGLDVYIEPGIGKSNLKDSLGLDIDGEQDDVHFYGRYRDPQYRDEVGRQLRDAQVAEQASLDQEYGAAMAKWVEEKRKWEWEVVIREWARGNTGVFESVFDEEAMLRAYSLTSSGDE